MLRIGIFALWLVYVSNEECWIVGYRIARNIRSVENGELIHSALHMFVSLNKRTDTKLNVPVRRNEKTKEIRH